MCVCGHNCAPVRGPSIPPDLDDFEQAVVDAARGLSNACPSDVEVAYERLACALVRVRVFAHDADGVVALERILRLGATWGPG